MSILDTIKALFCKKCEPVADHNPETQVSTTPASTASSAPEKLQIPEDSALKRHFLTALKADVEAKMPPKPTDSSLKRHYNAAVQAKLDDLLA